MSLKEVLLEVMKDARRNKNVIKKNTITMVRAAIQRKEVDERIDLSDDAILEVIEKQLKEKKMAIDEFKKGDRQDLVDLTLEEIEFLLKYLPEQLSEDEIEKIVIETIEEVNAQSMKDIGLIMKAVMPKVKGRTDGNTVNKIIKKRFN